MSLLIRGLDKNIKTAYCRLQLVHIKQYSQKTELVEENFDEEFRVLNLRSVKAQQIKRRVFKKQDVLPPRFQQMPVDQDWSAVWPGTRTFHPASVPLPVRQGYTPKNVAPPSKYANAELMKIPNFLHLTPPIIRKQCIKIFVVLEYFVYFLVILGEALKKFCTAWPVGLETKEKQEKHFPMTYISNDYVHGLPTIRNPMSRVVTLKLKLATLNLNSRARDKFLRLVGERYNSENDEFTLVVDRCPLKKQNYDYGVYLMTALYHECQITEDWENTKVEADMEIYQWNRNKSKETSTGVLNWPSNGNVEAAKEYQVSVENLINEGENEYNIKKYKEEVLKLVGLAK